jgi:LysM repeat protein
MWIRVPPGAAAAYSAGWAAVPATDLVPWSRSKSKAGETFAAVAKRVGVPASRLAWYNPKDGASKRALPAGTTILVPSPAVLSAARSVPDPGIEIYGGSGSRYVVKRGDTLSGLAQRFRTSVTALKRLNKISGDAIRIGQTLRIR